MEAVQTQPVPHPVAVWEKPNQETPLNQGESKEANSAHPKNPITVTAIGDSVMIDITPYLKILFLILGLMRKLAVSCQKRFQ